MKYLIFLLFPFIGFGQHKIAQTIKLSQQTVVMAVCDTCQYRNYQVLVHYGYDKKGRLMYDLLNLNKTPIFFDPREMKVKAIKPPIQIYYTSLNPSTENEK